MKRIGVVMSVVLFCLILSGCTENLSEQGLEYLESEQYDEAIEQFEMAVDAEVNVGDAYRGIGIAKWELEDYEGSRDAFQKAVEQGVREAGTVYNLIGLCEMQLGNPVSAQNYFRLGIGMDGNSAELDQEMKYNIVTYEQTEDWESAKVKLREYVAEYPEDGTAQKELDFLETR